ncbi:hypothetical protein RKD28_003726 [Streptomyces sp. SAI-229]
MASITGATQARLVSLSAVVCFAGGGGVVGLLADT